MTFWEVPAINSRGPGHIIKNAFWSNGLPLYGSMGKFPYPLLNDGCQRIPVGSLNITSSKEVKKHIKININADSMPYCNRGLAVP